MSKDEQLQVKKDTLWDIHEQESLIACLEKRVQDQFAAMAKIHAAWDRNYLGVSGGHFVTRRSDPATQLPNLLGRGEFVSIVQDLEEARKRLGELKKSFERM